MWFEMSEMSWDDAGFAPEDDGGDGESDGGVVAVEEPAPLSNRRRFRARRICASSSLSSPAGRPGSEVSETKLPMPRPGELESLQSGVVELCELVIADQLGAVRYDEEERRAG